MDFTKGLFYSPKFEHIIKQVDDKRDATGNPIYHLFGKKYFDSAQRMSKWMIKSVQSHEDMKAINAIIKDKKHDHTLIDSGDHYEVLNNDGSRSSEQDKRRIDVKWDKSWEHPKRIDWLVNHYDDDKALKRAVNDLSSNEKKYAISLLQPSSVNSLDGYSQDKELFLVLNRLIEDRDYKVSEKQDKARKYGLSDTYANLLATRIQKKYRNDGKPAVGFSMDKPALKRYVKELFKTKDLADESKAVLGDKYMRSQDIGIELLSNEFYDTIRNNPDAISKGDDMSSPEGYKLKKFDQDYLHNFYHIHKLLKEKLEKAGVGFGVLGLGYNWDDDVVLAKMQDEMADYTSDISKLLIGGTKKNNLVDAMYNQIIDGNWKGDWFDDVRSQVNQDLMDMDDTDPSQSVFTSRYSLFDQLLANKDKLNEIEGLLKIELPSLTSGEITNAVKIISTEQGVALGDGFDVLDVVKLVKNRVNGTKNEDRSSKTDDEVPPKRNTDTKVLETETEQTPQEFDQISDAHNKVVDRLKLRARFGIQGADGLDETSEQKRIDREVFKSFQNQRVGFGLVKPDERNPIYEGNVINKSIQEKGPNLLVGSQEQLVGNDIVQENQPLRQIPLNVESIITETLIEKIASKTVEMMEAKRGGSLGNLGGIVHDKASNDQTGIHKRSYNDIFIPTLQEGNSKRQRVLLPVYDGTHNSEMTSIWDRQPDHLKRFTYR